MHAWSQCVCATGHLQLTVRDSPASFANLNLGEGAVVHDNPLGAAMHDNPLGQLSAFSSAATSPDASPRPTRVLLPGGSAELPSSPLVSLPGGLPALICHVTVV